MRDKKKFMANEEEGGGERLVLEQAKRNPWICRGYQDMERINKKRWVILLSLFGCNFGQTIGRSSSDSHLKDFKARQSLRSQERGQ